MDVLKEQVFSVNIIAWILIACLIVIGFKFLMTAGKGLIYAILMVIIICLLYRFFPEFVSPILDLISAGGDELSV